MDIVKRVQVFGDSIAKGVLLDKNSGRYYLSKESNISVLETMLPIRIKNNAKFGCTVEYGFDQLQKYLEKEIDCDIALIEYGGNDCDYKWEEVAREPGQKHLPNTPLSLFEGTYRMMVQKLKKAGVLPLMMSLPPIDAQKYFEWITRKGLSKENIMKFIGDVQHIYRFQELYSNTVTHIALETNSLFVDIRKYFLEKRNFRELICEDGIHPNAQGQGLINQAFVDFAARYNTSLYPSV